MCLFLFLPLAMIPTQMPENKALPVDWHGRWVGTLKVTPLTGKPVELPMELLIEPIAKSKSLRFEVAYKDGKQPVRKYELQPGERANTFVIDEKNGILIDAVLLGNCLYSQFEVGGTRIQSRYELVGDTLKFEITAGGTQKPRESKPDKSEMVVRAFSITSVQSAELKKK